MKRRATFPPPPITYRDDGAVTLAGWCGQDGARCQLIAQRSRDGRLFLAFHGVTSHSMHLTGPQQDALVGLITGIEADDLDDPEETHDD